MISKWIHLDYRGGDPWMLPIISAANAAVARGAVPAIPLELSDLSLFVSTRLDMLPRVVGRINSGVPELYAAVKETYAPRHVFTPERAGAVVRVDDRITYELLVDIDSLLFELNALAELMKALFVAVYRHTGRSLETHRAGEAIQGVLVRAASDLAWFRKLDDTRNIFAHTAAPYVAISIADDPWDVIVMKRNLHAFTNPDEFILLSGVNAVVHGFTQAMPTLQAHLAAAYS